MNCLHFLPTRFVFFLLYRSFMGSLPGCLPRRCGRRVNASQIQVANQSHPERAAWVELTLEGLGTQGLCEPLKH